MKRIDGRDAGELRKVKINRGINKFAEGSCLIEVGLTKVICTASVEEQVPVFLRDTGTGWVTAEYGMLPRSCSSRTFREASRGKVGGRTQEIQRLIGRSLRQAVDMKLLGPRTIWIDCDVIQADGGTRTASITGGCVALYDAVRFLIKDKRIEANPFKKLIAAVSAGIVKSDAVLDLNYSEDSGCDVDMNIIMTETGEFVEIQGTGEGKSFSKKDFDSMLKLAKNGILRLVEYQKKTLGI